MRRSFLLSLGDGRLGTALKKNRKTAGPWSTMIGTKRRHKKKPRIRGENLPQGSGSKDKGNVARAVITKAQASPMAAATRLGSGSIRGITQMRLRTHRQGRMVRYGASR
jgi:hypothetical protein